MLYISVYSFVVHWNWIEINYRNTCSIFLYTVKLVYKDHPRDQQNMVLIYRWSLEQVRLLFHKKTKSKTKYICPIRPTTIGYTHKKRHTHRLRPSRPPSLQPLPPPIDSTLASPHTPSTPSSYRLHLGLPSYTLYPLILSTPPKSPFYGPFSAVPGLPSFHRARQPVFSPITLATALLSLFFCPFHPLLRELFTTWPFTLLCLALLLYHIILIHHPR